METKLTPLTQSAGEILLWTQVDKCHESENILD